MRILGLPGSLREGSFNRRLLEAAAVAAAPVIEVDVYDGLGALPLFSEDLETDPKHPAVQDLHRAITAADAVLIATPEYNGSIPGPLKNALDWASRPHGAAPLVDKAVAVVGASPGRFGAVRAQADVRRVVTSIGCLVLDREFPLARAFEAFTADGRLSDPDQQQRLDTLLAELAELTTANRDGAQLVS
jgi:chromate reductase, NAD(P)H dehydrogenase (quinone)